MTAMHREVSLEEALIRPYPYVYVNDDGSVRELHARERNYLETPFEFGDGNRPYIKGRYGAKDGWGSIAGYCRRSKIPAKQVIGPAPDEDPFPPMNSEELEVLITAKAQKAGFGIERNLNRDGSVSERITRRPSHIFLIASIIAVVVALVVLLGLIAGD